MSLSLEQKIKLKRRNYLNSLGNLSSTEKLLASRKGGLRRSQLTTKQYTREKISKLLKEFYLKNGRIPFKKEFLHEKVARREFGSWNKAIIESGFKPNPVKFSKKYIANDGHICDSLAEKLIDDWLNTKQIIHERNARYNGTHFTCDFKVKDFYIEFFGLSNSSKKYDESMRRKLQFIKENKLKHISIYQKDIFPKFRLQVLLKDVI
ncbi:hypothetical protein A3A93_05715 [Candidatus Roizmanbacteria bacterium RIFCSPLOWO2_01_FULL_38_12]|uniref:Uncharacterized protein n=1 Tax=Candidatus Roizmanbacteria bacterium RIFCSPLOWO2_01_FULL_38_12 TaxID=1802061 RepID=A0A1F7IV77_9BACT|nr:MAG: hypothetical protein A3F59_03355 [Candidatus Roizmanbacteria bacterium RIFCSPHIGHO2_12_FULL_38_13]OGK47262.1 MAG: hypothetical protein A3A93_05715 [Candidatus Roizmanbacteria bacterium RIFCSPLOWO2_01_FULL_38_12]